MLTLKTLPYSSLKRYRQTTVAGRRAITRLTSGVPLSSGSLGRSQHGIPRSRTRPSDKRRSHTSMSLLPHPASKNLAFCAAVFYARNFASATVVTIGSRSGTAACRPKGAVTAQRAAVWSAGPHLVPRRTAASAALNPGILCFQKKLLLRAFGISCHFAATAKQPCGAAGGLSCGSCTCEGLHLLFERRPAARTQCWQVLGATSACSQDAQRTRTHFRRESPVQSALLFSRMLCCE